MTLTNHENEIRNVVVLIVDDVEVNRVILDEIVGSMGYGTMLAENGQQALERVRERIPSLVLTDISMPEMDGYELCRRLQQNVETRTVPVVFISAFGETKDIAKGFDMGGMDYITKPFVPELVQARINVHLRLHDANLKIGEMNRRLQVSLKEHIRQMEQERKDMLYALAGIAVRCSGHGSDYIDRMRYNCRILAQSMQISPLFEEVISDAFVDVIELASPLCDIGNVGIPQELLQKKGALDEEEWKQMRDHTNIGTQFLKDLHVDNEFMQITMDITHYHHENWDGSGYPEGRKGDEIPLAAQIVALANVFCALTEDRSFRARYSREEALEIMAREQEKKYNPHIFQIFCKIARQLR